METSEACRRRSKTRLEADPNWGDQIQQLGEQNKRNYLVQKEALDALLRDAEKRADHLRNRSDRS